jgi:DDE family transposase
MEKGCHDVDMARPTPLPPVSRLWLFLGGLNGLLSVAGGAYARHGALEQAGREMFGIASNYHASVSPRQRSNAVRCGSARNAVYANRNRLRSAVGKQSMRHRAEIVERSFAHNLERGGMRRTWLRGRENVHKRYLIHVAGHNLGMLMRFLIGAVTPKEAAARGRAFLFANYRDDTLAIVIFALDQAGLGILVVIVATEPI